MGYALGISRKMRRYRDELFEGVGDLVPRDHHELLKALCSHLTMCTGREVRLMFESFPADTVSGLWVDLGDFDLIVVEANTAPLHQIVIAGHELWHHKEGHCGHCANPAGVAAAARMLGDRWSVSDAIAYVAARGGIGLDEERRAETFGRLLAAKFLPYMEGDRGQPSADGVVGRIQASLKG
ncbi:toxin-antitoxin system, toxin component [Streptomyces sp. bgisy126]|uniref:toxin-antitoxin system, toxin component n=1 Tax=unclassified Streptomyces TaxID=2593676 RepID=UPI003EC01C9C